jgi:hypothetical protein
MTSYVRSTDYTPPPCATCGSNRIRVAWVNSTIFGDPTPRYSPATETCRDCWPFDRDRDPYELDYPA